MDSVDGASHATEARRMEAQSSEPLVGYKRQRSKAIICRGKRPDDIVSNESLPGDAENVSDKSGGVDKPPNPKR